MIDDSSQQKNNNKEKYIIQRQKKKMIPQDQQVKHHDESRTKDSKLDTTQKKKEKDGEKITLRRLQKPVFDSSLYKKNDGTVSGSLLTVDAEEPFLCTPLDITESNLLAWLMRDSNKGSTHGNEGGEKYEKPLPDHIIEGEKARYASEEAKELYRSDRDYHNRRELNRILASRLELGTSIIDEDGRLLPVPNNDENNNDDDGNSNSTTDENLDEIEGGDENRDNDDINDENQVIHEEVDHGFFPAVFGNAAQEWLDEEEERRRHIQRQEQDAEEVIALAVKKYRDDEVPEDSFIFIPIPSRSKFIYTFSSFYQSLQCNNCDIYKPVLLAFVVHEKKSMKKLILRFDEYWLLLDVSWLRLYVC